MKDYCARRDISEEITVGENSDADKDIERVEPNEINVIHNSDSDNNDERSVGVESDGMGGNLIGSVKVHGVTEPNIRTTVFNVPITVSQPTFECYGCKYTTSRVHHIRIHFTKCSRLLILLNKKQSTRMHFLNVQFAAETS